MGSNEFNSCARPGSTGAAHGGRAGVHREHAETGRCAQRAIQRANGSEGRAYEGCGRLHFGSTTLCESDDGANADAEQSIQSHVFKRERAGKCSSADEQHRSAGFGKLDGVAADTSLEHAVMRLTSCCKCKAHFPRGPGRGLCIFALKILRSRIAGELKFHAREKIADFERRGFRRV